MGAGAILLGLEVIWFRFMRLYVASTSTAFCVMLAVVLVGIGLGSVASNLIPHRLTTRKLLPIPLLVAAIATLLSYLFFPVPVFQGKTNAFHIESWQQIERLSLALRFPVAFLSGILFPLILTCVQREMGSRMNSAGLTILFNTTGAAVGPLLVCFVLLPWLGFQSSLILSAAGYAGLAVLASEKPMRSIRRPLGIAFAALAAMLILIIATFPYKRNETHFANARHPYEADGYLVKIRARRYCSAAAGSHGEPTTTGSSRCLFHVGHLPRSQRYMRLFAYLPLVLVPKPKMHCCSAMAWALPPMHSPQYASQASRRGGYLKRSVRSSQFYSGLVTQSVTGSSGDYLCADGASFCRPVHRLRHYHW
jgi:hypothetical protein